MYIDKNIDSFEDERLFMDYVIRGDRESFEQVYYRVKPWLIKLIYRLCGSQDCIEDILQETWTKVCRNKHLFNPQRGRLYNFIFTIAKNEVARWQSGEIRFRRNEPIAYGYDVRNDLNKQNNDYGNEYDYGVLQKALSSLKETYRDIIILHYFGELEVKEIANMYDKPEGTIKTWLFRARKKLEAKLK